MIKKTIKISASIPFCLNTKLEYNASRIFRFAKGYKRDAIIQAVKFWIWIVNNDPDLYEKLENETKTKEYALNDIWKE